MKSKRSRTYFVSGLTLAMIFVAIILVFRDVLPDIVKDLSTVPFWGVLLLLALGFAYEVMESVLCSSSSTTKSRTARLLTRCA